jgi:hypothetical protein
MGLKFLNHSCKKNPQNVSPDTFESAVLSNWCLAFRSPAIAEFRPTIESPVVSASLEARLGDIHIELANEQACSLAC